jgi:predicted amidohydrolase YtcJ
VNLNDSDADLTVFVAKKVITMERDLPEATAVAVMDGRIAGVGTIADLAPWMDRYPHTVDRTFADKILMPGFVDPHLHPILPAVLTQMPFIAPDAWHLPTGDFPAVASHDAYVQKLRQYFGEHDDSTRPFFTWGYHEMFHGQVDREFIDANISADEPVFIWHRSFHEIITNSAGLKLVGISELADVPEPTRPGVDLDAGRFSESGLAAIFPLIAPYFFAPDRLTEGLQTFAEMVHRGGVTQVADMGTGLFEPMAQEAAAIRQALEHEGIPFRTQLTPIETSFASANIAPQDALAEVNAQIALGGERVFMAKHFKLMIDGAFFSLGFQMCEPGYIDGHEGAWVVPPETTESFAKVFWDAGFTLHAHCNGDGGAKYTLDLLNRLLDERPRFDHRFTLEHYGYSTEEQNRRLAALGAVVSGQPWYVHILGDKYSEDGLGADRAHQMCRFGSLVAKGVPLGLHSDCTMAPLEPLRLAWAAATRQTTSGQVIGANECLSLDAALRAITIDAAWVLRLEDQIGTIRAGKRADFVVLESDPYEVGAEGLPDIKVWGTVFAGVPAPIPA